jgi:hypothetical protein
MFKVNLSLYLSQNTHNLPFFGENTFFFDCKHTKDLKFMLLVNDPVPSLALGIFGQQLGTFGEICSRLN